MARYLFDHLLTQLRTLAGGLRADGDDAELLDRFLRLRDEMAFTVLVQRHGRMVLGVCARVLPDRHEAEDAFQSTFLVLARKAPSIRKQASVASWLYGVAYRLSVQMKRRQVQRQRLQERASAMSAEPPDLASEWRELKPLLDEELHALPEKYRAPVVLCYLEEKTNEEAAGQLGWPMGTLKTRLARAREILQGRLARRGVALSTGLSAPLLAQEAAAAVPRELLLSTAAAAARFAFGETPGLSAAVVAAANQMVTAMFKTQLKRGLVLALLLSGLLAGGGLAIERLWSAPQEPPLLADADLPTPPRPAVPAPDPKLPAGARAHIGDLGMPVAPLPLFFPDGKRVAYLAATCLGPIVDIYVYDMTTGKQLYEIDGAQLPYSYWLHTPSGKELTPDGKQLLHITPDGTRLLTLGEGKVQVWDGATGKAVRAIAFTAPESTRLKTDAKESNDAPDIHPAYAFSPDGKLLACHAFEGICLYDLATGRELRRFGPTRDADEFLRTKSWKDSVTHALAFAADGKSIASLRTGEDVCIWDVASGKKLRDLPYQGRPVATAALLFSLDGKRLALRQRGALRCWDVADAKVLLTRDDEGVHGRPGVQHPLGFSPDSNRLSTGSTIYTLADGTSQRVERRPFFVSLLADDRARPFAASNWDLLSGKEMPSLGRDRQNTSAALSTDGKLLALAGTEVRLYRTTDGKEIGQIVQPDLDGVHHLDLSADGKLLACACLRRHSEERYAVVIRVWDLETGKIVLEEAGKEQPSLHDCPGLLFTPDGKGLLVGTHQGSQLLDLTGGKVLERLPLELSYRPRFSPDGTLLAIPDSQRLTVYDWPARKELRRFSRPAGAAHLSTGFAFSPDSQEAATTAVDGLTWRFHTRTGKQQSFGVQSPPEPQAYLKVGGVAGYGSQGRTLCVFKEKLRLYELATGKERLTLTPRVDGPQTWGAMSADGTIAVTRCADGTYLVWDLWPKPQGRIEDAWADLASEDAGQAFQAIRRLAADPAQALPILQERLKPAAPVDPELVARWLADLNSDNFRTRQQATQELERLGEETIPALQKALADKPALETRTRLDQLLDKAQRLPPPEAMRGLRAVEVLEHIGTAGAQRLLRQLADGAEGMLLTREAQAALQRLAKQPTTP